MKNYKKITISALLLLSVLGYSGCELTELENKNYGNLTPGSFPATEAELKSAIVAVYNAFPEGFTDTYWNNSPGYALSELPTDEMNTGFGNPWQQWDRFQWEANHTNSFRTSFYAYSKGVTNATIVLGYAEKLNLAAKDSYIAELKALRALLAFNLYDMFGPVPLLTKVEETQPDPNYTPVKPTPEQMVGFIESELLAAIPDLKTKAEMPAAEWGHLDRGTALTVLLKLYLKEKRWSDVVATATQIEALGYSLYDNYTDVFNIANDGKNNKEIIFALSRIVNNRWASSWNAYLLPADPKIAKFADGTPLPANALTAIYGGLKLPWAMYDKFEETDKRRKGLIRYYYNAANTLIDYRAQTNAKATGAAVIKFGFDPGQTGERQGNDFIYYRYADVLLAKAEALNELNGLNQASVDLINQINARAFGVPAKYTLGNFTSKENFRDFILDERFRELYLEGHRRQDLIRHNKFISKAVESGWAATEKHNLFPIPSAVIDQYPSIIQNEGY